MIRSVQLGVGLIMAWGAGYFAAGTKGMIVVGFVYLALANLLSSTKR